MPADDDVFDAEHVDRILQHRETAEIVVEHQVRDVAVHEELAGRETHDLVGGDATVGAADPEVPRRLLRRKLAEEARVALLRGGGPAAVVGEEFRQLVQCCGPGAEVGGSLAARVNRPLVDLLTRQG